MRNDFISLWLLLFVYATGEGKRHHLSGQSRSRTESSLQSRNKVVRRFSFGAKFRAWTLLGKLATLCTLCVRRDSSATVVSWPSCISSQGCYVSWEGDAREDRDPSAILSSVLSEAVKVIVRFARAAVQTQLVYNAVSLWLFFHWK